MSNEQPHWRDRDDVIARLKRMRNDLEAPARVLAPTIGDVLSSLSRDSRVLLARMSGSGATCFALVDNHDDAMNLARAFQEEHPSWWIHPARLGAIDARLRAI
jgi:4-diphosphocytidyl-2-C-methyl-D-erythritol kinase